MFLPISTFFLSLLNVKLFFFRNNNKLKETKEKLEQAGKDGFDTTELKKQIEDLDKEKKTILDEEEQMRKQEKVNFVIKKQTFFNFKISLFFS